MDHGRIELALHEHEAREFESHELEPHELESQNLLSHEVPLHESPSREVATAACTQYEGVKRARYGDAVARQGECVLFPRALAATFPLLDRGGSQMNRMSFPFAGSQKKREGKIIFHLCGELPAVAPPLERPQSREDRTREAQTLSKSIFIDALEQRKVRKADRLKRLAPPESVCADPAEGWEVGKVHTRETRTVSESVLVNALEQRQVSKADRLKRLTLEKSECSDIMEGRKAEEVQLRKTPTLSESSDANALQQR